MLCESRLTIDIHGRAEFIGDFFDVNVLGEKPAFAVGKMIHIVMLS
jgi:hypothetical protein